MSGSTNREVVERLSTLAAFLDLDFDNIGFWALCLELALDELALDIAESERQ